MTSTTVSVSERRQRRRESAGSDAVRLRPRLASLRDIASLVSSGGDLQTILDQIVYAVCRHSGWAMAGIMCIDESIGYSVRVAGYDPFADQHPGPLRDRWALANSPVRQVIARGVPVVIADAAVDESWPGYLEDARARGYHTTVVVPLGVTDAADRPMVLSVESREVVPVGEGDIAFLQTIAHQAEIAVRNNRRLIAERRTAARLEATFRVHAELMQAVLDNDPLDALVARIDGMLAMPLLVLDATANVITATRSPIPDCLPDAEFRRRIAARGARSLLELVRDSQGGATAPAGEVDFGEAGIPFRARVVARPLQVDGELLGGLLVFPGERVLDELDLLAVNEASFALAMHLMRSHERFRGEAGLHGELLSRLFAGDFRDEAELVTRAGYLGINLTRPGRLLVMATGDPRTGSPRRDRGWQHRALARAAGRQWRSAKLVRDGEAWTAFIPVEGDEAQFAARLRSRAARFAEEAAELLGEPPLLALSGNCLRPSDYRDARSGCDRILALARALDRRGVLAEEDFGAHAVLLGAAGDDSVRRFVAGSVRPLAEYDRDHGTELLATLALHLRGGCRPKATADALGIHVSTLRYRLDRIRELSGADLDDADQRFGLDLAVRLHALLDAPRG